MRIFDEPEDVIRMLQSPATDDELAGEQAAIDRMVAARGAALGGAAAPARRRRPYRLGALVAAGVIGFGGVAAAGPGGFDVLDLGPTPEVEDDTVIVEDVPIVEDQPEEVVVEEVVVDDDVVEDDEQESTEDEGDEPVAPAVEEAIVPAEPVMEDNLDTSFPENLCADGPHGATVSQVARGLLEDLPPEFGVVDAAHSDCGKQAAESESVEEPEGVEETPEPAEASSEDEQESGKPDGQHPGKKAKSNGNGGGQGKAKGKGGRD